MNEALPESQPQEASPEPAAEQVPASGPPAPGPFWLRWAYTLEFLIALLAIFTLWGEIGGEGHLELMPWYTKLACVLGLAWCCVGFTAGIVEQQKFWTARSIRWFLGILLLAVAMGGITYYYHLHEEPDDEEDDTAATAKTLVVPGPVRAGNLCHSDRA